MAACPRCGLDEAARTGRFLSLLERLRIATLRERGLGVLLISHNMADVTAVADTVNVLRLGKNNGSFPVKGTTNEEIIAAITGATDNAVTRRRARNAEAAK